MTDGLPRLRSQRSRRNETFVQEAVIDRNKVDGGSVVSRDVHLASCKVAEAAENGGPCGMKMMGWTAPAPDIGGS